MCLTPGSVTPLGLLQDPAHQVQSFLDADFLTPLGRIGVHSNDNTATVCLQAEAPLELLRHAGGGRQLLCSRGGVSAKQQKQGGNAVYLASSSCFLAFRSSKMPTASKNPPNKRRRSAACKLWASQADPAALRQPQAMAGSAACQATSLFLI